VLVALPPLTRGFMRYSGPEKAQARGAALLYPAADRGGADLCGIWYIAPVQRGADVDPAGAGRHRGVPWKAHDRDANGAEHGRPDPGIHAAKRLSGP